MSASLEGRSFGRLTVIAFAEIRNEKRYWLCECDCGRQTTVRGSHLTQGRIRACGCQKGPNNRAIRTTHGLHDAPEYAVWKTMKARCSSPTQASFKYYGGRGIAVCERWRDSFEAFYADMGPRPTPSHSIDRKDVNGNYEPGNCRWATWSEQNLNKRPREACGV